ncbi:MAG: shikimate kinase [Eggerthellaceae bacterium]|nr:shikimate kinase [Eggerthellaceae bacterium]
MTEVFDFRKTEPRETEGSFELACPVFFVGFMGAGKTSVARKLARYARVASVDMDTYIERLAGKKVREIFDESGEEGFRALETTVLEELGRGVPQLVSCGGGVVLREKNRELLKAHGFVIHLQVTADEAASRISNIATRPLFGDLEQARRLVVERAPLYEEVADLVVDTAGRGTGAIAREVLGLLKKKGVLTKVR